MVLWLLKGGRRKTGYGLSTASFTLWIDLIKLFNDIGIIVKRDKWTHQTYKKEYYGISFKEREYLSLLAGMPERSNGLDLGSSGLVPS